MGLEQALEGLADRVQARSLELAEAHALMLRHGARLLGEALGSQSAGPDAATTQAAFVNRLADFLGDDRTDRLGLVSPPRLLTGCSAHGRTRKRGAS